MHNPLERNKAVIIEIGMPLSGGLVRIIYQYLDDITKKNTHGDKIQHSAYIDIDKVKSLDNVWMEGDFITVSALLGIRYLGDGEPKKQKKAIKNHNADLVVV